MSVRLLSGLCLVTVLASTISPAVARDKFRYPRVYGSTGRLYGPTQAHYQYARQYGRAWHGYRGLVARRPLGRHFVVPAPTLPFAWGAYAGPFGPRFGLGFPVITPPVITGPVWGASPWCGGGWGSWGYSSVSVTNVLSTGALTPVAPPVVAVPAAAAVAPPVVQPVVQRVVQLPPPAKEVEPPPIRALEADAADRIASIREQALGDQYFRNRDHMHAFDAYKTAIRLAGRRPAPYYRLAWLFAAMERYEASLRYLKQGLDVDPDWPVDGDRLIEVYGARRRGVLEQDMGRVMAWMNASPNDPDRLLLAGAMLHFNGQRARAVPLLEAAATNSSRPFRANVLLTANTPVVDHSYQPPESLAIEGSPEPPLSIPGDPARPQIWPQRQVEPPVPPTPGRQVQPPLPRRRAEPPLQGPALPEPARDGA